MKRFIASAVAATMVSSAAIAYPSGGTARPLDGYTSTGLCVMQVGGQTIYPPCWFWFVYDHGGRPF